LSIARLSGSGGPVASPYPGELTVNQAETEPDRLVNGVSLGLNGARCLQAQQSL
jgi:hypothetical protein